MKAIWWRETKPIIRQSESQTESQTEKKVEKRLDWPRKSIRFWASWLIRSHSSALSGRSPWKCNRHESSVCVCVRHLIESHQRPMIFRAFWPPLIDAGCDRVPENCAPPHRQPSIESFRHQFIFCPLPPPPPPDSRDSYSPSIRKVQRSSTIF